ncbi:type IV toxin-antitoxin system AbiEi family antitoxin domain-containing protein [Cellulosimicrobium funkei]|uniref:type IV toxin-antitoxin system AbiEi family antitoxin domain-containing protein n=1 Tax=Cellulosimicrobium funkei TaxID=264251 RepID=UPI0036AB5F9E
MHDDDPLAPGGPRRPALLPAAEHPPQLVRQAASSGSWERVRRGVYRETGTTRRIGPADERDLVLDRATALHRTLRADHVLSHTTAALVHGLRLWTAPRDVHVVQPYRRSGRADPTVARHLGLVDAADRCVVGGLPVTTPARTVADCLRTLSSLEGLVVADAALARGLSRKDVAACLARQPRAAGAPRARHVLRLADAGAESAWETWLRYLVLRLGLPRPSTQVPGPYLGRPGPRGPGVGAVAAAAGVRRAGEVPHDGRRPRSP